jgi:hypothetical protein
LTFLEFTGRVERIGPGGRGLATPADGEQVVWMARHYHSHRSPAVHVDELINPPMTVITTTTGISAAWRSR